MFTCANENLGLGCLSAAPRCHVRYSPDSQAFDQQHWTSLLKFLHSTHSSKNLAWRMQVKLASDALFLITLESKPLSMYSCNMIHKNKSPPTFLPNFPPTSSKPFACFLVPKEGNRVREHVDIVRKPGHTIPVDIHHAHGTDGVQIVHADSSRAAFNAKDRVLARFAVALVRACCLAGQQSHSMHKVKEFGERLRTGAVVVEKRVQARAIGQDVV